MNFIEVMVSEHKNISRMLRVIRKYCLKVLNDNNVDYSDFHKIIDFIRNYADKHHHGKEEKFLFVKMVEELKGPADKLVTHGMLVEHDLGRLFIKNLETAVNEVENGNMDARVDVIANAIGYADLLTRHIEKEDNVVYKFAENNLSKSTLQKLEQDCDAFEKNDEHNGIQNKYLSMLKQLEQKYDK
ncbi:hemerythrin domain-containing protein [Clostridium sp. JN-9]|uniref:hemerythrin domain-containing protein n=1 Tax=Clostridium sp. JN-9 TaxID=2507159 RepID=UPI000FFE3168|nr:hemerythrin domain-containing protein [Clostridium sp. JN-9]QAT40463.1 hemerythrin domain-containing protein [Clostridium sp. JN-9]